MLRYFYLLFCLLVCIEWTFCYEYIKDDSSNNVKVGKFKLRHGRKGVRRGKRHELELEANSREEPKTQIDLANFMQQPDVVYNSVDDSALYENNYKRDKSSEEYREYDSISELLQPNQLNENNNDLDSALSLYSGNLPNLIPQTSSESYAEPNPYQNMEKRNPVHKKEKKCSFHSMKFPFFSHKKTVTPKPKKNKKRRLFNFHHSSKMSSATTSLPKISDANPLTKNSQKSIRFNKRTATRTEPVRYCSLCKRKIESNVKKKKVKKSGPHKLIHNTRQYFQEATDLISKEKKEIPKYNSLDIKVDNAYYRGNTNSNRHSKRHIKDKRRKREEEERERQLKELEEVEKKIDNIQTTLPSHQRNS